MALTGTPGTGKTSVARRLAPRFRALEVGALARRLGMARGPGREIRVDLGGLNRRLATDPGPFRGIDLVVGHLSHLLPVRDAIVLRCHPVELLRRLERARRGNAAKRRENILAEATDIILMEARGPGRRVWEIDTTARTPKAVAAQVARHLARRGPSELGHVDWLADPAVTEHLLEWGP